MIIIIIFADMENNPTKTSRRRLLKSAAVTGAVSTGLTSTAIARQKSGRPGDFTAESRGVQKAVRKLLNQERFEEASALLEKHGVEHSHRKMSYDPTSSHLPSSNTEQGVTTQGGPTGGVFSKSESDIDFFMYNNSGDLYTVEIAFDHTPHPFDTDCLAPNDVLAVTYNGARWQYVGGSKNIISGDLRHFDSRTDGVKIEWYYDAYPSTGETSGHFATMLRKADNYHGDPSNVWAHYKHVYTPFYKLGCYNGLLGSNLSLSAGYVGISFNVNDWEKNTLKAL